MINAGLIISTCSQRAYIMSLCHHLLAVLLQPPHFGSNASISPFKPKSELLEHDIPADGR